MGDGVGDTMNCKLPNDLESQVNRFRSWEEAEGLRLAILNYGREREEAAMQRAAEAVSALSFGEIERLRGLSADRPHEFKFGPGVQSPRLLALNEALSAIRGLIVE